MKYEYLCGYESDFFAMPANVIAVVRLDHCVQGLTEFDQIIECGKPVLAMRRIIKEPKQWTLEDREAGLLPEVGCRVDFCHKLNTNWRTGEIKYSDNQVVVIKADDIDRPFVYEPDRVEFKPIEKAQREEDEWVNKAWSETAVFAGVTQDEHDRLRVHLKHIYRAQLSGELKMPESTE